MNRVVIHIGFGKTGTSSLQSFLSSDSLGETAFEYCAIETTGEVLCSSKVAKRASKLAFGYVASTHDLSSVDARKVRSGLNAIHARGRIPILSHEHWSSIGHVFAERKLLEEWGIEDAHVIAYVRPQVEYLNSGWWQWWAWSGRFQSPTEVVEKMGLNFMLWHRALKSWSSLSRVARLSVRLHGGDTIGDFLSVLGIENVATGGIRKNVAMSQMLIQLYRALPGLRTVHGSEIDSLIGPYLKEGKPPWVVSSDLARKVIQQCREDNLALRTYLSSDQQREMAENSRWWSHDSYQEAEEVPELTRDDAINILSKITPVLIDRERRYLMHGR
jgi:hypothetical protein